VNRGEAVRRSYEDSLKQIQEQTRSWGDPNQSPASKTSLEHLETMSEATLDYEVSPDYLHFLALTDGLHFNGFVVFASATVPIAGYADRFIGGFVESNLKLRDSEVHRRLVVFAEAGDEIYVFDQRRRTFARLDHPSLDPLDTFGSFDEMMAFLLDRALTI
jgi:hypothetical protein